MRKIDAAGNTLSAERNKPGYVSVAQFAALTPNDADECYLIADATKGVIWHFRFNAGSASAYKWECLGGPPLVNEVQTSDSLSLTSYGDLATVGPSSTAPRAGEYISSFGMETGSDGGNGISAVPKIGAAAAVDADSVKKVQNVAGQTSWARTLSARAYATSDLIKLQYKTNFGGPYGVANRWLSIYPVRIS